MDDAPPAGLDSDAFAAAQLLIHSRHNLSARRLLAPGPNPAELHALLQLAAAAPDHGQLTPWRFVTVPPAQRGRLGEAFAQALAARDAGATAEQLQAARDKALRAPLLLVAIAALGVREPDIPPFERLVSLGAAIQNLLLGAHAMGYATSLTSGKAMASAPLRALLALEDSEHAVCCINIGTARQRKADARVRPAPEAFTRALDAG